MNIKNSKPRLLSRQVWCIFCIDKKPPRIKGADYIIPARKSYYDLSPDKCTIDPRVVGICNECLNIKSNFHKDNAKPVDINHKHLIYGVS